MRFREYVKGRRVWYVFLVYTRVLDVAVCIYCTMGHLWSARAAQCTESSM